MEQQELTARDRGDRVGASRRYSRESRKQAFGRSFAAQVHPQRSPDCQPDRQLRSSGCGSQPVGLWFEPGSGGTANACSSKRRSPPRTTDEKPMRPDDLVDRQRRHFGTNAANRFSTCRCLQRVESTTSATSSPMRCFESGLGKILSYVETGQGQPEPHEQTEDEQNN